MSYEKTFDLNYGMVSWPADTVTSIQTPKRITPSIVTRNCNDCGDPFRQELMGDQKTQQACNACVELTLQEVRSIQTANTNYQKKAAEHREDIQKCMLMGWGES